MYSASFEARQNGKFPRFKGLLEIISSEVVILTAVHNIKANQGSETPGSDGETMRNNILEQDYQEVISRVKDALRDYNPVPVRRVYIPKPGKAEKRPLGIPAAIDKAVQECVRIAIEPILEAQFFAHSYGFRPMRDAHMVLERVVDIAFKTGYHWIIEGDISKFFENVNHTKLVKKLWHMGICDRRVLMIIKAMLKAGIMGELEENPLGTQQGGIISPLLANAYLDTFDQWVTREWENKKTKTKYSCHSNKLRGLKRQSNLKPAYLVRYADDWTLTTSSRSNAEKWKRRIAKYLDAKLKLTLSEEKTIITDTRKKPIHFLGFTFKVLKGKSRTGYITKTSPDTQRLKVKVAEILRNIKGLKRISPGTRSNGKERLIAGINLVNSQVRGIIQYYQASTRASPALSKYSYVLGYAAYKALKRYGGKWVAACEVNNLTSVHAQYKTRIPAIALRGYTIGITSLAFCKWTKTWLKNQSETPYTKAGRDMYQQRTSRKRLQARADELLLPQPSAVSSRDPKLYNFEYYLNRAYAFNRDLGKCKICGDFIADNVHIHHIRPNLPRNLVNRVSNLASAHNECHEMVHDGNDYSSLPKKVWLKILRLREKLNALS
jgi:RNA-directed DNA polymerase